MAPGSKNDFLIQDAAIILGSIVVAVVLAKTDVLKSVLSSTKDAALFGSFIAGMFFTSVFTAPLATVALGEIAQTYPVWLTALFGAMGAVIGDLIIFRFIRDRFSEHVRLLAKRQGALKNLLALFKLKYFRWFTFLTAGLIIASPLPDELGISLLGFSKMRSRWFIPLSFFFNFLGILVIGLVARTL